MNYGIYDILNNIAYKEKVPNRWGYQKINNKVKEYAVQYGARIDDELFIKRNFAPDDGEANYFVNLFQETFTNKQLYFILKDLLTELELDDLLHRLIVENGESYEEITFESLPNLKEQLEDTRKVLAGKYSKVDEYLTRAYTKFVSKLEIRNALDDLRFALEQLLQAIYKNGKTFENNVGLLAKDIKSKGIEPHISSMVYQLLKAFSDYQNSNVKHKDTFNDNSADFIFDITAVLIKFIVKLF
ncbi:MAG: hypothetical protein QM203_04195 [Bacillota bacterium]|nr:hypothetical protein [Bacillota bacterium]